MEVLVFAVSFFVVTACAGYLYGRLRERDYRVIEKNDQIDTLVKSSQAYQNQLLTRQGAPPIFEADGTIRIEQVPSTASPIMGIMRPPFAQAELDWDDEEMEIQQAITANPLVPALTDEQKAEMIANYGGIISNNGN